MLPVLTLFSFVSASPGVPLCRGSQGEPFQKVRGALLAPQMSTGLLKATVFGVLIVVSTCGQDYGRSRRRGVGTATTKAVVWGNMLILVFNYVLSSLLFGGIKG